MDSRKRPITQTEGIADGPPAVKVKLSDDLPRVVDDLDDATHKEYDERVNKQAARYGWTGEDIGLYESIVLFSIIVAQSGGKLHSQYALSYVVMDLLEQYPALLEELQAAWKIRSYRNIRTLALLRGGPGKWGSSNSPAVSASYTVTDAWDRPYSGSNHKVLLNNLNSMDRENSRSNTAAVLQSSGSGKSRMVREQATLVFTLPFNLRPDQENRDIAYPPADIKVRDYLTVPYGSFSHARFRFTIFFKNLFSVVAKELPLAFKDLLSKDERQVAAAWRSHLDVDNRRSRLYNEVAQLSDSDVCDSRHHDYVMAEKEAVENLDKLLKLMKEYCDFQGPPSDIRILLYFDEAHVLATVDRLDRQANVGDDNYDAFWSAFNLFRRKPIFALFLSTHWLLSLPSSARMWEFTVTLQAPITETPFDCSPTLPVDPRKLTFDQICEIDFLAQYGRPLFWSILEASKDKDGIRRELVDLARGMLLCHSDIDAERAKVKIEAQSALLDVLLILDFEPRRHHSHRHQAEMVASHMRIAYSVPSHRESFRSGYPSEPILAEAAARQIAMFQQQEKGNVMASMLKENLEHGLIALGERGEVVMRILLMEAYLRSVRSELGTGETLNFSKGCSLVTFIKELFTDKYASVVLTSRPDNLKSEVNLEDAFPNAVVRFTHFVKAADATVLGTDTLLAAFIRGMAYICWLPQDLVHLVIPILLERSDLAPSSMTAILIQVNRRRIVKGSLNKHAIDQQRLPVFPANDAAARPYLTLVAKLENRNPHAASAPSTPAKAKVLSPPMASKLSKLDVPRQPQRQHHQPDTHPRYSIRAYGCSNIVYKGISESERSLYHFLLTGHGPFSQHARQDRDSLKKMQEMKPAWSTEYSYNWVDSFADPREEPVVEEGDRVEVGSPSEMDSLV